MSDLATAPARGRRHDPAGAALQRRYRAIRAHTDALAAGLSAEDQTVQSMPDASPAKWHRAHTTWFFEAFVLARFLAGFEPFDPAFQYLFNSYYDTLGPRHPRPFRGLLSRPGAGQVTAYRRATDAAMARLLADPPASALPMVELGLQHEQQHQELLVTDILHAFAQNPLCPACLPDWQEPAGEPDATAGMVPFRGGLAEIGHAGPGFHYDSEAPRHRVHLEPYRLGSHLVRNAAMLAFIADGGYSTPTLWMSDGWTAAQAAGWSAPLYWRQCDGGWQQMTPAGLRPLDPAAPLRHISWYEADALARWSGARLPTEAEFEAAADHPGIHEQAGHVWQWTASAFAPYPGYRPPPGAVGEYNGKFMVNQMVLRGGSAATPAGHARSTYRNFFHPDRRWQFTGVRLAGDC